VNGQAIVYSIDLGGDYNETIVPIQVLKTGTFEGKFFSEHIKHFLKCFKDNVVLTIYEKGMFVTQQHGTHSLMYLAPVIPLNP
jgi:hypothetical protein